MTNEKLIDARLLEILREAEQPDTDEMQRRYLDYEYDRLVYIKSVLIRQRQRKEQSQWLNMKANA